MAKNINVVLSLTDKFTPKMSMAQVEALKFKTGLEAMKIAGAGATAVMQTMERYALSTATAIGVAGAALAKTSLEKYSEFETRMNNIGGVTQMNIDKLGEYEEKIKAVARTVSGINYQDAADTFYYESLAGWDKESALKALPDILKAVRISGEDTKTVSDAVTDSMTALGLSYEKAGEYIDKCTVVQSKANTNMLQLQNGLIKTGAAANALGVPLEDTMTMLGVLASGGKKGEEGGTIVNALMTRFVKTGGNRREAMKGLEALGLSGDDLYDATGKLKSFKDIFLSVGEAAANMTEQQKNNAETLLGGSYFSQLMELGEAVKQAEEDGNSLNGLWDKIHDSISGDKAEGAADRYISYLEQGYSGAMAKLKADIDMFEVDLGEQLAPYASKAIEWLDGKLPEISDRLENELPAALAKGEEIVKRIYNLLVWIWDHKDGLMTAAALTYGGAATVRAGADIYTGVDLAQRAKKGLSKISSVGTEEAEGLFSAEKIKEMMSAGGIKGKKAKQEFVESLTAPLLTAQEMSHFTGGTVAGAGAAAGEAALGATAGSAAAGAGAAAGEAALGATAGSAAAGAGATAGEAALGATAGSAAAGAGAAAGEAALGATAGSAAAGAGAAAGEAALGATAGSAAAGAGAAAGEAALGATAGSAAAGAGAAGTAAGTTAGAAGGVTVGALAGVAAIVVAIAVAIAGAYKNSENFRNSIKKFGETATSYFEKFKDILGKFSPVFEEIKSAAGEAFGFLGDVFSLIIDVATPVFDLFMKFLTPIADVAWSRFCAALGLVATCFSELFSLARDALGGVRDWISYIDEKTQPFRDAVNKYFIGPVTAAIQAVANFISKWNEAIAAIKGSSGITSNITMGKDNNNYTSNYKTPTNDQALEAEGHALGTNYWKGGITRVNENGGEIMDLPQGTRIIPADKSAKIASGYGGGIVVNVNVQNMYGEDERYVERIGNEVAGRLAAVIA